MASNMKRTLSRVGHSFRRQVANASDEQEPLLVIDHDELTNRGHCADCYGVLEVYVCKHAYLKEARMCPQHESLPVGKPSLNFTPKEAQQDGSCPPCLKKAQHEKEYSFFQLYRELSSKKWSKEKDRETMILREMERAHGMATEDWEAEKLARRALLAKKDGIVGLSAQDAAAQKAKFQEQIVKETVKKERQLTVGNRT